MQTDKPLISIVMAVYEPRMDWLREQLESLNAQTYPNLELIVCDDCSPSIPYEDINKVVAKCITDFPYEISRNEMNLGSNATFELLTKKANGEYIAYCDQDDIWLPEKLEILYREITEKHALLVCSDMFVIDEEGNQYADSITKVRKHHIFYNGEGLASKLIYRNFVTGCTMLINVDQAKSALPFPDSLIHDHWLAYWCAIHGKIISLTRSLIYYRIHGNNQTDVLCGIKTKKDYMHLRVEIFYKRVIDMDKRATILDIGCAKDWATARYRYWNHEKGALGTFWVLRKHNKLTTYFEIIAIYLPEPIFMVVIQMIRKGFL